MLPKGASDSSLDEAPRVGIALANVQERHKGRELFVRQSRCNRELFHARSKANRKCAGEFRSGTGTAALVGSTDRTQERRELWRGGLIADEIQAQLGSYKVFPMVLARPQKQLG
jgi:hypothetical protein